MQLKTVARAQGSDAALRDGTVRPRGFGLDFVEYGSLIDAFRRMARAREFDLSEMPIGSYITARVHGKRLTGLPIFVKRAFHHGAILYNTHSGVGSPRDLEGKRVGLNRGYTVTTGLWGRSILANQYGVDLSRITWLVSGDEHVAEYRPPANVVRLEPGQNLADMLASGELPAAIGVEVDHPDVRSLIPAPREAAFAALRDYGHYPINHLMVVKDEVLQARPELAPAIFDAFAQAKRLYVERLRAGTLAQPTAQDDLHRRVMETTGRDPLPYGIESNRAMLEEVVRSALEQQVIDAPLDVEEIFPANTHALSG